MPVVTLWGAKVTMGSVSATPNFVVTNSYLISANTCGKVTAFDLLSGRQEWMRDVAAGISGVTVDQGRGQVYVSSDKLFAIAVDSGRLNWTTTSPHFQKTTIWTQILANQQVLVYVYGEGIWILNPRTGELVLQLQDLPKHTFLYTERMILTYEPTTIRSFDTATQTRNWSLPAEGAPTSTQFAPYITEGLFIYRWSSNGENIVAVDEQTGKIRWQIRGRSIISNVVVSGNVVYFMDREAKLYMLDATTGMELGTIQFQPPSPSQYLYAPGAIGGSSIAVSQDIVAIHFRDTNVLSVVQIKLQNKEMDPPIF